MLGRRKATVVSSSISIVLLLENSSMWQYMAVAVAGAGAEIMDKVGAENK